MAGPSTTPVRVLPRTPSLGRTYVRSLLAPRDGDALDLPRRSVEVRDVRADAGRLAAFARLCGFPLRAELPLPFPHLIGFGLQVDLLVREPFPFRLLGLVHVRQEFEQQRPLGADERLDVRVRATGLRPHRRGATVDLVTEVRPAGQDGEPVWRGLSRYLARGVTFPGTPAPAPAPLPAPEGPGALWRLPADLGRRFAGVSGDVNPLHLSALTAKALGFRRALAHGVWTASHSLAALGGPPPAAARFAVEFAAPVLLPSTVVHVVAERELAGRPGWSTAVRSRDGSRLHLTGRLEAL
ncbi:MaoC family dehydratase [Kineococcus rubinsiae]|uniref:MaoC family dehydratase n=1 Tax=Kineococcus rubinsiae TaxID=2609562 RepID=UPI001431F859|nr:MaoC/PaaZ C-terminal domain-containing protein [Kineococcus rubinsiae]NIZ91273.1 hypothetical protein [Kineococcus rubinsiae]